MYEETIPNLHPVTKIIDLKSLLIFTQAHNFWAWCQCLD
jgi:hypothetical protein